VLVRYDGRGSDQAALLTAGEELCHSFHLRRQPDIILVTKEYYFPMAKGKSPAKILGITQRGGVAIELDLSRMLPCESIYYAARVVCRAVIADNDLVHLGRLSSDTVQLL
jgi:hypothetical protein